jgi:flagellar biosynthetic protein FlhB
MASDEFGEKTEQPTERRRMQAREQGNIARSTDVTATAVLLAAAGALYFVGPLSGEALVRLLRATLSSEPRSTLDVPAVGQLAWSVAGAWASVVGPLMGAVFLGSLAINLLQTGFLWAPEVLQPQWGRLNPIQGLKRLFSLSSLVRLAGSSLKILAVAAVSYLYLSAHRAEFLSLSQHDAALLLAIAGRCLVELAFYLALTLAGLAVLDYGYQFWHYEQELKMTRQELREELKEMDGNPLVRQRRREAHRKLVEGRRLADVKTADVVITNPTHIAVAVKYDPEEMPAPTVVAKGMGELANQIRRLAVEHGIPIIERKPLAQALYRQVKVGQPIPVEMYEVFVEILAYVYRITGKKPKLNGG